MRQFNRPNIRLPTLVGIETKYGDGRKSGGDGRPPDDLWKRPDVMGALYAMQGRVCAYCEQKLPESDRGDVEHFRPKSLYRWLAYAFENYLLSCGQCNSTYKRSRFPLRAGALAFGFERRHELAQEQRLLLNPAEDPTEAWLDYDVLDDNGLCPAVPREGLAGVAAQQVAETIDFFQLNLRRGLVQSRLETIDLIEKLTDIEAPDTVEKRRELMWLASRYSPHSTVARKLLRAVRPEAIPGPADELDLLVEELCDELKLVQRIKATSARVATLRGWRGLYDEILWALAVLWHAPLAASSKQVETWLTERGAVELVAPYRKKLVDL